MRSCALTPAPAPGRGANARRFSAEEGENVPATLDTGGAGGEGGGGGGLMTQTCAHKYSHKSGCMHRRSPVSESRCLITRTDYFLRSNQFYIDLFTIYIDLITHTHVHTCVYTLVCTHLCVHTCVYTLVCT
jgi:hypothetical protein